MEFVHKSRRACNEQHTTTIHDDVKHFLKYDHVRQIKKNYGEKQNKRIKEY